MSAALTDEMILVAVLSGLASLGIGLWANRREIARLKDRLWGPKRGVDSGIEGAVDSLSDQLRRIEEKIDAEAAARREEHDQVETEIRVTRRMLVETTGSLVETLAEEIDGLDVDRSDLEPEWYDRYRREDAESDAIRRERRFED